MKHQSFLINDDSNHPAKYHVSSYGISFKEVSSRLINHVKEFDIYSNSVTVSLADPVHISFSKSMTYKKLRLKKRVNKLFLRFFEAKVEEYTPRLLCENVDMDDQISKALEADDDDGEAARMHLAAGRWITYREPDHPDDIIREWPDGRREFINVSKDGQIIPILDRIPGRR